MGHQPDIRVGQSNLLAAATRERRLQALIEASADWLWEIDAELRFAYFSANFAAQTGVEPSRLIGRRRDELPELDADPAADLAYERALTSRTPFRDITFAITAPGGERRYYRISGLPIFDQDGVFCGYHGTGADVTAEVEAASKLRESEERFRQLFEAASDWFWEEDAEGRLTYVSPRHTQVTGNTTSKNLGLRRDEYGDTSLDPAAWQKCRADIAARRPFRDFIYKHKRPDANGRRRWTKTSGIPVFAEDGAFRGYRGAGSDVTTQVEAEIKLRESEERFRQLFEAASDWFWEMDADLRLTYVSPNHATVTQMRSNPHLGRRREEYGDTSINGEAWRIYLAAVAARQPFRDFIYRQHPTGPDGKPRWVKTSGVPVFASDGAFRGYRGAASDVTAEVEAAAAARKVQLLLHEAIANVGIPVSIYDAEQRFLAGNQAYRDLHRGPDGESIIREGLTLRELMEWRLRTGFWRTPPVEDGDVVDGNPVDGVLNHLKDRSASLSYELADGRSMLIEHRLMKDGSNVSTWTDVTSIRSADAERRELERQLHHSQKLDALGQLAGGIAHDLNNALVPVLALTKMVQGDLPAGSPEHASLDLVIKGGQRCKTLVQQILSFSRKETPTRGAVDFAALVLDAMAMLRASVPATIELATRIAPVGAICGDAGQLHQVVVNLITNAAQSIGAKRGTVTVTVAPADKIGDTAQVLLRVADTGMGMDEGVRAHLFEPFFTTKPVGEGTGLGLAVVHGIVTSHGGTIAVNSRPGEGARFDILLPQTMPCEDDAAA